MSRVLWELMFRSLRGRLVRWARLLARPRYLAAFLVGLGYIALSYLSLLFMTSMPGSRGRFWPGPSAGGPSPWGEAGAVGVAIVVALGLSARWLFGRGDVPLRLTSAEGYFLLSAPLPRREVMQYAALRSQPALLFTSVFLALLASGGSAADRLARLPALWLFFTALDLHGKGRALFQVRLADLEPGEARRRRLAVWGVLGAVWLAVGSGITAAWMEASLRGGADAAPVAAALDALRLVADDVRVRLALAPILCALAPLRSGSDGAGAALGAWIQAAGLVVLLNEWVVRSRARFEDAALEQARRESERGTRRPGGLGSVSRLSAPVRRRHPFRLAPHGIPETAILWKNFLLARRTGGGAILPVLVALWAAASFAAAGLVDAEIFVGVVALQMMAGIAVCAWSPSMPGMAVRNDLRSDLLRLETVKAWPVDGPRLVLAEVLAPALRAALHGVLGLALVVSAEAAIWLRVALGGEPALDFLAIPAAALASRPPSVLAAGTLAALPVVAGAALLSAAIQNLTVLLFPSWSRLGPDAGSATTMMGQQIVFALLVLVALAVGFVPGVLLVGAVLVAQHGLGAPFLVWELPLLGGILGAFLMAEGAAVIWVAAGVWDRLDASREVLAESPG